MYLDNWLNKILRNVHEVLRNNNCFLVEPTLLNIISILEIASDAEGYVPMRVEVSLCSKYKLTATLVLANCFLGILVNTGLVSFFVYRINEV